MLSNQSLIYSTKFLYMLSIIIIGSLILDHSYDHNRLSSHQKYSKNIEYSHSYNKDYVQNYGKDYSYYVNPRSNSGDSHVPKQNYSRYRIDYHQNQRELRNVESISPADFL